jgi:hypothetical protein
VACGEPSRYARWSTEGFVGATGVWGGGKLRRGRHPVVDDCGDRATGGKASKGSAGSRHGDRRSEEAGRGGGQQSAEAFREGREVGRLEGEGRCLDRVSMELARRRVANRRAAARAVQEAEGKYGDRSASSADGMQRGHLAMDGNETRD